MIMGDIVKRIFEISGEKEVDVMVAGAMFREENKDVDTTEAEKFIKDNYEEIVAAYKPLKNEGDTTEWDKLFPVDVEEVDGTDVEDGVEEATEAEITAE